MKGNEEAEAGGNSRRAGAGGSGRNPRRAALGASCDPSGKEQSVAQDQQLIEALIERDNLNRAWKQVSGNRGSPGVDGRDMDQTKAYLKEHWEEIEGHCFCQYADDCNIYVGTERSGQRLLESIMDRRSLPK